MLAWFTKYLCIIRNFLKKMLRVKDSTAYSLRDIIKSEITHSLALPYNPEYNAESRIHEYRKSIKRCRSLLCLFKQCINESDYERLDNKLSVTAGEMAERRDATVNLRTFLNLTQFNSTFLPDDIRLQIANELTKNLEKAYSGSENNPLKTEAFLLDSLKVIWNDMNSLNIRSCTHSDFLNAIGIAHFKAAQLYYDSRNTLDTEIIHKWRKFTKRLLLQLKYTPDIDRLLLNPIITKLDKITDLLGRDHDLAVLENKLIENFNLSKENIQKIHLVVTKERAKLQKETFRIGEEIFSEKEVRSFKIQNFA